MRAAVHSHQHRWLLRFFSFLLFAKRSGRMGNRRYAKIDLSDEDDDGIPSKPNSLKEEDKRTMNTMKQKMKHSSGEGAKESRKGADDWSEDAKPIGNVIRVSTKGRTKRNHFAAFEYDGNQFELEDSVLLVPEDTNQKPFVAIIKDIFQNRDGSLSVSGQWFYRPEEAPKKGGGSWQSHDTRELFYSFHCDVVPAESVMHKCAVHFIPSNKQIPHRKLHPGFIVQRVYDVAERRLWKLTDKDYEDGKQQEIDLLVKKTRACLGELPDIETVDTAVEREDLSRTKRILKRKSIPPIDVSRDYDLAASIDPRKGETPNSGPNTSSEYYSILIRFNASTGNTYRNKWLERLLQGVQHVCNVPKNIGNGNDEKERPKPVHTYSESANASKEKGEKDEGLRRWPDDAVPAVTALEQAVHEAYISDHQKYNQKMRKLDFNLKSYKVLARRLVDGELQPSQILDMTADQLKEGLTAEEAPNQEPDESKHMQMTDARCRRCSEKTVGLTGIIHGGKGDRYQLECVGCGNTWFASSDELSALTIQGSSAGANVGAAPLATAKFEDAQRMVSPRELERMTKTTEAYMPVLEPQKSFKQHHNSTRNAQ